jgi:hypothetical protein
MLRKTERTPLATTCHAGTNALFSMNKSMFNWKRHSWPVDSRGCLHLWLSWLVVRCCNPIFHGKIWVNFRLLVAALGVVPCPCPLLGSSLSYSWSFWSNSWILPGAAPAASNRWLHLKMGESNFNGRSYRIQLMEVRKRTIFLAIFSGDIPWNLGLFL